MDKEQKAAFSDMGKQAAYLYNGAFEVFQNSKQAEKIVFLFFFQRRYLGKMKRYQCYLICSTANRRNT